MIPVVFERFAVSYIVKRDGLARRLVEETETHVLVGLLLLLLLSGGGLSLSGTTSGSRGGTTGGGTATRATRGNGSELLGSGGDELVDVLALKLGDELVQALVVGLDTNGAEDGLWRVRLAIGMARRVALP